MLTDTPKCGLLALFGVLLAAAGHPVRAASWTPRHVEALLLQGTIQQRTTLAVALHLMIPKAARAGATADLPCDDFDSVKVQPVPLRPPGRQVVLTVASSMCGYTYVVVLAEMRPGTWHDVRTIPLLSKYTVPQISFHALVTGGTQEIIVHNQDVDDGTGIQQRDFVVWKLLPGGLQVVLDEPARTRLAIPQGRSGNTNQSEQGTFIFKRVLPSSQHVGLERLLEKQTIRDHGTRITRWWRYRWSALINRFQRFTMAAPGQH